MDLIKDDVRKLFYNFLIPAISSAVAVAAYSLVDTIASGQGVEPDGTAACLLYFPSSLLPISLRCFAVLAALCL